MKKNILIAVTVIVSLCLLYWGIEFLKGINLFTPANFYIAKFDKVDGLVEAAPVTIKGFQVGQIKELNYDYENNEVSIMLSMNKDLKIPVGSAVHIESSLTGTATLALELSDSKAFYKVGDEIPTVRKQGLLDRVSAEVVPQVEQILPQVDSILANVNNLTGDPALYASVARLDAITADLAATSRHERDGVGLGLDVKAGREQLDHAAVVHAHARGGVGDGGARRGANKPRDEL